MKKKLYNEGYYERGRTNLINNGILYLFGWINLYTLKKYFKKNSLILEVGCGEGKISRELSRSGLRVDAIDISREAIEISKKQISKVNYRQGDIFSLKAIANYYDAVYSLHVMEHIENIGDTLKEIYRIMKKGGKLIIRIPNGDSLEAKLAGNNWFHWDEPYHINHWTSSEFKNILLIAGFKLVTLNFNVLEYKQVLLYSCVTKLGIKTDNHRTRLWLLPLQIVFVPISIILGYLFKDSGTVELIAEK